MTSYIIEGAVVKEQDVKFAVIVVHHDVTNVIENMKAVEAYKYLFPDMPIILLGRDRQGKSIYYGQENIANFLATLDPNCIPWRRFVISD